MGQPKHSLIFPDERSMVSHLIERIRSALSGISTVHISLRDEDQSFQDPDDDQVQFIYDSDNYSAQRLDLGPASGLLAAHYRHPTVHWLVIACDYPLLHVDDLRHMIESYESPLTCFENASGWPEPRLAIWSPSALQALEKNVQAGITGPVNTLRSLQTKRLKPLHEQSLLNANTPADWDAARRTFLLDV
ncbi:Putative molybdenum cofactor guanylyltransferase, mobA-like NTP transferase [Septoria linicola]|uniref:Molybdenum cofactor guanylyltransferase, mobA-like NTP transferase n=1 Tax=Septoria linicola TaxID=215465 RepID=A0A9Q9B3Y5_9PEZI|nr:Putative molybdenum cofactor guanylyltransferase, mobA-like NTP transferase [Septoria linicola]